MKITLAEKMARQEALYNFLLTRGDIWTSMERCTDGINLYPAIFTGPYHDMPQRRLLSEDINNINNDPSFPKIIIHSNDGIKLAANEEEAIGYYNSRKKEALKMLKMSYRIAKKISRDQQISLEGDVAEVFLKE